MSYEYKKQIKDDLKTLHEMRKFAQFRAVEMNIDDKYAELDHVYAQAAKADEYEAKAIILERVKEFATEPPFLLANNEHEDYELYAYDQILRLIEKYESGESNE